MAKFLVIDPGEFIAIDPKSGEEKFRAKTNIADANGEWVNNFVKEIDRSIGKANKENDVKDVKKYPINELYYLRYDLRIAEDAGEKRHPSEVIKELGGKELAFDGCPIADCDFILAQFGTAPTLPEYILDKSTYTFSDIKEHKGRIREEFPEFILEE